MRESGDTPTIGDHPAAAEPSKPSAGPLPIRVAQWVFVASLVLAVPLLFLGRLGWLGFAVNGIAAILLSVISLFNISGERERARQGFAYSHYWLDRRRRFRAWYPEFMQRDWYLVGSSVLFLLVGLLFFAIGVGQALRP